MDGSIALNQAVREYPHPSARYREVFNATARELGLPYRWTRDEDNPNAIDPAELDGYQGSAFDDATARDLKTVLKTIEERRLEHVEKSFLYHKRYPFRAPLERLSPVERRAVEHFAHKVKPLLSRIEAVQNDPEAPAQQAWMKDYGDYYSGLLFERYHREQLAGPLASEPAASLFPFFPDQPEINGMIGPGITLEDFRCLAASLPPDADELRPTTALFRDEEGAIACQAWPLHPSVREEHRALAKELEAAAELEVEGEQLDPAVQRQLKAWARFFRYGSRDAEAAAVQASIDAGESGGNLRIHLGPSESYWPDNTKFPYLLQVGVRIPEIQEELSEWKETFPPVERSLEGIPHYAPRELSLRGGFAEPLYQALTGGFIETYSGREPRGNNFPNYNYGTEGSNRFIVMEALPPLAQQSRRVFDRVVENSLSLESYDHHIVLFATGHESGHLIGPQRDHVTPEGRMGTVFGELWGKIEEPKADLTALEMVRHRYRAGEIDRAERDSFLAAALGYMLTLYASKEKFEAGDAPPHYYGYTLEIGHFFQAGALEMAPSGKLEVEYDRLADSAHDLWRRLITFQAAGDVEGFRSFARQCGESIPEAADALILTSQEPGQDYYVERHL